MNQRIRELAYRAANGMLSYDSEGEWQLSEQECNKFAELIVRECIRLCDQVEIVGSYECIDNIKEHFGVGD